LLRNFGIVSENEVSGVGLNGKLSELHAALGLGVLDVVGAEIEARGRAAARYREQLASTEGLRFQEFAPDTVENYAYFTVEIDADAFGLSRDEVHQALLAENIVARRYFSPLCSENDCYRGIPSARPELLPHARRLASSNLCLPIYGGLDLEDIDRIVECLLTIKSSAGRIRDRLRVSSDG
jgi:dTDP-4-amino-4,6-dideoxygalactose transaminase